MATDRFYVCSGCGNRTWIPNLFDALQKKASETIHACECCSNTCEIELTFHFGLDAGDSTCTVFRAFLPENRFSWTDGQGNHVEYFPFLVILESDNGKSFWLPYWHLINGGVRKYGQWAPNIDAEQFTSLLNQTQAAGVLSMMQSTAVV